MGRPRAITPAKARKVIRLRNPPFNYSLSEIEKAVGVSKSVLSRWLRARGPDQRGAGIPSTVTQRGTAAEEEWETDQPAPKRYAELSPEAQFGLQFFFFFCSEILGEPLHAHQESWHRMEETHPFTQINAHPRSGKTDLHNKKTVWRQAGGGHEPGWYGQEEPPLRDVRVMLVSGAENQHDKNFDYVAVRLAGHRRLVTEYGRFKEHGNPWRPSQRVLTVAGRRRMMLSGDFSLVCVGTRSHVLGRGADHIDCDDPFDAENTRTPDQIESGLKWLRVNVFSRLEPGGTIHVLGARLPLPNEPYTQIAQWPRSAVKSFEADDWEGDLEAPKLFHTIVQPAVLDWGARTVLCPDRFDWGELMAARDLAGEDGWEASWMQNPAGASFALAKYEWIYGDESHVGCLDNDRRYGESIDPLRETSTGRETMPRIRVVSIDPSDKKWWGIHCLDLFKRGSGDYEPVLIDLDRSKHHTATVMALLDAWSLAYQFRVLVLERNIAKFLIEDERFQDFLRRTRVKFIRHETNINKSDAQWGIGTLREDFEKGRIRIPNADTETRWRFQPLIKEALGELATDDTLLSLWFPKWHLAGLMAMASQSSGWQGWAGAPGAHRAPPPRVARQMAGAGR